MLLPLRLLYESAPPSATGGSAGGREPFRIRERVVPDYRPLELLELGILEEDLGLILAALNANATN